MEKSAPVGERLGLVPSAVEPVIALDQRWLGCGRRLAISGQVTSDLKWMMIMSIILDIVPTTAGLWLAYALNLTSACAFSLAILYEAAARSRRQVAGSDFHEETTCK